MMTHNITFEGKGKRVDKLDKIVREQKKLMEKIVKKRGLEEAFSDSQSVLRMHALAIYDETAELQRELSWKWWTNDRPLNIEACKEELIDILHFDIQALIYLGCDADDILDLYLGKNKENHDRQAGKTDRKGYNVDEDEVYENVDK